MAEISDLPIENNNRWAQDQQNIIHVQIKEDFRVAGPAGVDVTEPSYASQLTTLVGDKTSIAWASIEPPAIYFTRRSDVFKTDLLPRFNNEKLLTIKDRLESLPETPHGK